MKKKICLLLLEMIMVMALICACSDGSAEEETPDDMDSTPMETAVPEQSDVEAEEEDEDPIIAPDLNRNGIIEEVYLTDIDDGQGQRLEIRENNELIDSEEGYFGRWGRTSIFLCTLDGEDYLLCYYPTMYQGVCSYYYALSALTDNGKTVVQRNFVDFDINFGSPMHNDFDPDAIAAFMDEINDLLSHSVQMLNTYSDLSDTFEKEGRFMTVCGGWMIGNRSFSGMRVNHCWKI